MPLTLIPPGRRIKYRKGRAYPNRYWLVRGDIGGREREVSTKERDEDAALRFKARLELRILERRIPGPGEEITLGKAADLWVAYRKPGKGDERRVRRVVATIGAERRVSEIQHADLVDAAHRLFPGRRNETKNRWAMKPAASILHYAAKNRWRDWLRIEMLEEGPVVTRASSADTARALLSALEIERANAGTEHKRRLARKKALLILWLFKHGNRISDPLRLTWEQNIALPRKVYLLYVGKARRWKEKPIDEEVWEALANDPEKEGPLFPWRTRSGVYRWLRPLVRRLRLAFTPHMARHYLGKQLNAEGAGQKTIMGALDHDDPASSLRYQDADMEIVRAALAKPSRITPKKRRAAGKSSDRRRATL